MYSMSSFNIILECPLKSKRYNIEITNDVTPFQLEQEFKEQFFSNDEKLKFYLNNKLLIHNKPLIEQNVVKGSLVIIRVCYPITLTVPIINKCYSIEVDEIWTIQDLNKKLLELVQVRSEEISFQVGLQVLKPNIPLIQQGVGPKCSITVNIQQQGGVDLEQY